MKEDYSTLVPKNRKNYSKSPKEISIYISDKIIAEQQKSINKKNNFERYGKSKEYIEIGIKERLSGLHDFNIINRIMTEVENLNRGALLSYIYGYTEASDRRLVIGIVNKEFNQAQLENIGYIDAIDPNIEFEKLPNIVKENIHYLKGYKEGLEEIQKNININKGEKHGKIKRNKCFKSSRFNNNGKSFKKTFSK